MVKTIFYFGILAFFCCLLIQIIIWRFFLIKKEIITLGSIFFVSPLFIYLLVFMLNKASVIDLLMIALLQALLSSAYLQTYPALREDIPSIKLLFFIKENPNLSRKNIIDFFSKNSSLIKSKNKDLISDGLIKEGNSMQLTLSGKVLAKFFVTYRKFLGVRREHG